VVVEPEVNETNKTTLRSGRCGALKKRKKVTEKLKKAKKRLDRAGIVRDASRTEPAAVGTWRQTTARKGSTEAKKTAAEFLVTAFM
jgi:hypothetical protein